ncbi:hypothetical protein EDB86DRAFT_1754345 [Lactarius hatsudake]|nr:hypothetical protein EDB86DRAFT_1754345 [Lactarius hatsudake]
MYAPLALKFVCSKQVIFEAPTYFSLRVPVKLTANPTTTATSSKSHTNVVSWRTGVLGGIAALLVVLVIALVVWRRRRQRRRRTSVGPSSLGEVVSQDTQFTVTPFNPIGSTPTEVASLDAGPQTDLQQQLTHRPSPLEDSPLPLRGVVSIPVGLSSKELARLRSLANRSRSQPIDGRPSNPPLTATADRGAVEGAAAAATPSSEAQILRSEVNVLRQEVMHEIMEIQQLHSEISEPPPSYASGAV